MLWLGRGEGEGIVFPTQGIEIECGQIRKGRVRVGVNAAAEVPVLRRELCGAVRGRKIGTAAYRVVWLEVITLAVGISSTGPYWTAQAAAARRRSEGCLCEVVIDSMDADLLAGLLGERDLAAIAAGSAGGSRGGVNKTSVAAWADLVAKLGSIS